LPSIKIHLRRDSVPLAPAARSALDSCCALRRYCEELAAEYRAPLPESDTGLIAAIERWQRLKPWHDFKRLLGIASGFDDERDIIIPIAHAAEHWIEKLIENWPVQGLRGVAAKQRYMIDQDALVECEDIDGD
jgi:hypothetical protein